MIVSAIGDRGPGRAAAGRQLLLGRTAPWIGASAGSIALAAGMVLIVLAAASDSSATYLIGSILAGAGFGIAFLGGLRTLVAAIPPITAQPSSRRSTSSLTCRLVPAVLAGLLVSHLGLQSTFEIFGSVVAAIARRRPRSLPHATTRKAALHAAPAPAPSR